MITLPASPAPNSASPELLDYGAILRPATGAKILRVNRAGSRYSIQIGFPEMPVETAQVIISRLQEAKRVGLRIPYPLVRVSQGSPGSPLIDGTDSAGTVMKLKALTPHYIVKEGYWLTVVDADGVYYLHNVRGTVRAGADGKATLQVEPPIRAPIANECVVLLAKPMVEGLVTSTVSWPTDVDGIVALSFTLEEAA